MVGIAEWMHLLHREVRLMISSVLSFVFFFFFEVLSTSK
jgi:hypothetical protein